MNSDHDGELDSPMLAQRMPSLNALRCFEMAARLEHFGRAADELHLTHGAISRAVRALEEDLGIALFERRSRRVFLTDAGRELATAVREGMERMRSACQRLRASAADGQRLTLSCEPTLLMRWLLPRWPVFLRKLAKSHPHAQVHLVAGGGAFSFSGGIDLAIRRDDFAWPPSAMHADVLFAERIGPVCRTEQVARWFTQKQLLRTNAPLLHTRTRSDAWRTWSQISRQALPPQTRAQANSQVYEHFYFSLQAAIAGLGVAIGPEELVRDDLQSGVLSAPLGFVEDGSRYCLLAPAAAAPDSVHALLLGWLLKQAS
ncbi:LysR family transcriptional regulator [Diaphorobacter sp. HDW4A]|uniref:LysR family transcriptional regulator n=1 Tax=Diaphorobacter sp. HDW4A TaxID=2714924 RepID=UPI0014085B71|nr:LysR family transcriptional regulator [Diaphorobacter sp. HDW4A]QIL82762.1 LysR family transcriptional regulator [Diaphorobacter sp. HDW4A]